MSDHNNQSRFSLRTPAMVVITIAGYLDESWASQLGMNLDHTTNNALSITVLKGQLIDQAALFGTLNGLYGLGYPLISVECTPVQ